MADYLTLPDLGQMTEIFDNGKFDNTDFVFAINLFKDLNGNDYILFSTLSMDIFAFDIPTYNLAGSFTHQSYP